ncbi:hypothetical protein BN1708_020775, partial [Verticillium longisporum]
MSLAAAATLTPLS